MVEHHVWLVGELVDRAARLDDDALDEPIEVSVDNEDGIDDDALDPVAADRPDGHVDVRDRDAVVRLVDVETGRVGRVDARAARRASARRSSRRCARSSRTGRLDDTFVDALCDPPEVFTYGGMIAHVLTFAAYNRTLVVQALDAAGISDLGWGDPHAVGGRERHPVARGSCIRHAARPGRAARRIVPGCRTLDAG